MAYYNSISDLLNAVYPPSIGFASVLGYYTPGDWGGGDFYWDGTSNDPENFGTVFKLPTNVTNTSGRWKRRYDGMLNVRWFGAKGDADVDNPTPTDDTIAIQNALDMKEPVYFPKGVYKITRGLTRGTAGNEDGLPIIMNDDAIIKPYEREDEESYVALTIYPKSFTSGWSLYVDTQHYYYDYGTDLPTLDGILFKHCAGLAITSIRVSAMYGNGITFEKMFDTHIGTMCIERCGRDRQSTDTDDNYKIWYAVLFTQSSTGTIVDSVNESMISRLQMERCFKNVLYIDPITLNLHIAVCHSERAYADSADVAWDFGGASCIYENIRLSSLKGTGLNNVPLNGIGKISLNGESTTYTSLRAEKDFSTEGGTVEVYLNVVNGTITINNLNSTFVDCGENHNSPVIINSINMEYNASGPTRKVRLRNIPGTIVRSGRIDELNIMQQPGFTDNIVGRNSIGFENVIIQSVINTVGNPSCYFKNCIITNYNTIIENVIAENCVFIENAVFSYTPYFEIKHCVFKRNLTLNFYTGGEAVRYGRLLYCQIIGDLSDNGLATSGLLNVGSTVNGNVTSTGVFNAPPTTGNWKLGDRHYRVIPQVNQPKSWVYAITNPSPLTYGFRSEGNLT